MTALPPLSPASMASVNRSPVALLAAASCLGDVVTTLAGDSNETAALLSSKVACVHQEVEKASSVSRLHRADDSRAAQATGSSAEPSHPMESSAQLVLAARDAPAATGPPADLVEATSDLPRLPGEKPGRDPQFAGRHAGVRSRRKRTEKRAAARAAAAPIASSGHAPRPSPHQHWINPRALARTSFNVKSVQAAAASAQALVRHASAVSTAAMRIVDRSAETRRSAENAALG